MTKEAMKNKAVECLKALNIYKPYITGVEKHDNVCWFERFAGYWAFQDQWLIEQIKIVETTYNVYVYAVTHEYMEFGECYSMLIVPENEEEWPYLIEKTDKPNDYFVWSYVVNKTFPHFSEFGTIKVKSFGGGICRIA